MGEHYLKYRKRALQRQLANTSYMSYSRVSQDIGRQFGQSQQQAMNIMKRQGVPLAQRMAVNQQSQQQFAGQMGQQFQQVRQQESMRQQELNTQMSDTQAQLEEIQSKKEDALTRSLYQVGGMALGLAIGAAAENPEMGAQIGASVGEVAGGIATEEWDMALAGVGHTIAGISESAELASSRNEAKLVANKMAEIRQAVNNGEIDSATASMLNAQINTTIQGGGDIETLLNAIDISSFSNTASIKGWY